MPSSRRVKRSPIKRAYHSGYQAGLKGKKGMQCPFQQIDKRGAWFGGWREATEHLSGSVYRH